jgi:hypothetical protein
VAISESVTLDDTHSTGPHLRFILNESRLIVAHRGHQSDILQGAVLLENGLVRQKTQYIVDDLLARIASPSQL